MCPKMLKLLYIFLVIEVSQCSKSVMNSVKVNEDRKSSLAFVFDTTGSMYDDLEQLREGAEMILSTALEEGVIGDFVFVPFRDPAVGPATVTQDKDVFKNALQRVRVYGGGDCPEKSLGGIEMALDVSGTRSYVYVFTDATAGDHKLVGKVLDAVQRKQSQVVFVLTGHCNDLDKPSYKVYQQIAAASSGQVFNLNKTSVHKVLDFVKSSIKGRMVNLGSSVNPAGSNYTQDVPVDSTLGEVTVSVSGANPQITVVDPSGELLTGPPKLITTLDLAEIMVVKVMQPEPGNWTISVASDEQYSVKVAGLSNLTFEHGFSVQKPKTLNETSYRPLKGTYNHMMLSLTRENPPVTIDYAEVLTLTGRTLFELPLTEVVRGTYLAEAFIPPEEFFYIAINGRDDHNQSLRRIGTTAIQSKVPDVPYLTAPRKVTVHAHSRVVLACKADSLVPLVAGWRKGARKLHQISSLQTTTVEYVIEDIKEENVGTYKCFAQNAAGESKLLTEVTLIVDAPQVSIEPANVTLEIGDNVTITCTVVSEALLLKFRFVSNTTEEKVTDIKVTPNIDGVYSFSKTINNASDQDVGTFSCIAANKGGLTNQSTTLSVLPRPTAKITTMSPLYRTLYSLAQLSCQVTNCDRIRWVHNGVVKENVVFGSYFDVLEFNVTEEGIWECESIRGDLKTSDSIQILFLIEKPIVSIKSERDITILNGTVFKLECEIVSIPAPTVTWHRSMGETKKDFNNHTLSSGPNSYKYTSILTLNSSVENVEGTIYCRAQNKEGTHQAAVNVNVRRKMTVLDGFQDTSQELFGPVILHCHIDSYPPPQIIWHHNNTVVHSTENVQISNNNSILDIKRMDFENLGTYSCVASNGFEDIELRGTLGVRGLEMPALLKDPKIIIAKKNESTIIPCRVLKGNPIPSTTWYFRSTTAADFRILPIRDLKLEDPTLKDEGLYRCVAGNVLGIDAYDVEVEVHYPPQLKDSPEESPTTRSVEAGAVVRFSCEAAGAPPPIVFWTKDGAPLKYSKSIHLTDHSLVMDNVTEFDSGTYTCNATSPMGSVHKNYNLIIYVTPKILVKPSEDPIEVLEGELVELPCGSTGVPKPTMTWKHNGLELTDERRYEDEFGIRFVANLTDFGNFTCLAKNKYGNTSITYTLYIWVPPSIDPPLKATIDILAGSDVNLQCDVIGFPVPTVQWVFREELLKENTTQIRFNDVGNLYITNASSIHEGSYVCVAENIAGVANKLITLNVNEPPKILEDSYTGPYLATNLDSALTIACSVTGKPKPYVVWSKDGIYLHKDSQYEVGRDGSLTLKYPTEDMSGNYTCTAKNKIGGVNKTIPVEVYSLPTRTQSDESHNKATVLEHASSIVECPVRAAPRDTVKWYKDAELISIGRLQLSNITRANQATYACVVTNAVGSAYSTVNVDVEWPPNFITTVNYDEHTDDDEYGADTHLDDEENYTNDGETNTTHVNGLNDVKSENQNDESDKNDEIDEKNVNPDKSNNSTSKEIVEKHQQGMKSVRNNDRNKGIKVVDIVRGEDVYLDCETDANPIAKMKWLHNSRFILEDKYRLKLLNVQTQNAGSYKCIASNVHGSIHRQFLVNVAVPPYLSPFDLLDVSLMTGDNATLSCDAEGLPKPTINWTFNNSNWHLLNSTISAGNVSSESEGVYRCDAANKAGRAHIVYRVNVLSPAKIQDIVVFYNGEGTTVDSTIEAALGTQIRISCKSSGQPNPTVQWLRQGALLNSSYATLSYADLQLVVDKTHAGRYTCVAANELASDQRTVTLHMLEPPQILQNLYQDDSSIEVVSGQAFYLNCHPLGTPMPQVYWFKDGLPLKLFDESMVSMEFGEVLFSKSAAEDQSGNYTCIARNKVGNTSVVYLVSVLVPPPQPKESSKTVSIPVGRPLALTCPVEGAPLPRVMWLKHPYTEVTPNHRVTLLDDNVTLLINPTQVSDSGNYSCIMMNKVGSTEMMFSVTVSKPPTIAGDGSTEDYVVPLRRSLVLKCDADGHPLPKIYWLKDTQKLSNTSSNVHLVLGNSLVALWSVTSRDAAQYICVAQNVHGTALRRYNVHVQVPGKWSGWSEWSLCNATCGVGQQSKTRACQYIDDNYNIIDRINKPDKIVLDESACKGPSKDKRNCQMPPCEEEGSGVWSGWTKWSGCSSTCGSGTQARTRKCTDHACEGDNVQIRKCPDLPKCSSNEDNSENDVYSPEDTKEDSYLPEAVFEKQPEIVNSIYTVEEDIHTPGATPETLIYLVNVTSNLDGSNRGSCSPGYRSIDGTCQDIDECEVKINHCHSTQICENTEGAYRCSCSPGYVSLGVGQRCMDINECSRGSAGCEFACVNTAGGYVCACPAHMRLHADKHRCYTVSSYRKSYEELDTSEYLSASIEHPAKYKHIRNV